MKILFYDMGSYTAQDLIFYLEQAGHTCKTVYYHFANKYQDDFFCERFSQYLKEKKYDVVFSVNFFPLVAKLCHEYNTPYISWSYDSPLEFGLQEYFSYNTNFIFLFDRIEAGSYQSAGYKQVFHLPLAVNTERLDKLQFSTAQISKYKADISFVGQIYNSPLDTLLYSADEYTKGYIEGILQAQLRVYGYYFVDELITDELLEQINASFRKLGQTNTLLNHRGLSYAIASQITHTERYFLLEQMGELFDTKFYSSSPGGLQGNVKFCGPVKYFSEMPCVFQNSKLNLNPTLRSIQSGIPLRALDIMGSKGVLFSNYQPELAEYFEDGKDVIMYGSMEEAFDKAAYYLEREDMLKEIAWNGYIKVKEGFGYANRITKIIDII